MRGIHELWPRTHGVNWRLVWPWSGHRVRIELGPPFTVDDGEPYAEAAERLRARVDDMWQRL
jgi:hypothetical protein